MYLEGRRVGVGLVVASVTMGLLTGCVTVNSPSNTPNVTVAPPTSLPTIPVDTTKSLKEQAEEVKQGYCKLRNTPVASEAARVAKEAWNKLAEAARREGVVDFPAFDPDKTPCQ